MKDGRRFEHAWAAETGHEHNWTRIFGPARAAETSRLLRDDVGESVSWWHARSTAMPTAR